MPVARIPAEFPLCLFRLQSHWQVSSSYPIYFCIWRRPDPDLIIFKCMCLFPAYTFMLQFWLVPVDRKNIGIGVTWTMPCRHVSDFCIMNLYKFSDMVYSSFLSHLESSVLEASIYIVCCCCLIMLLINSFYSLFLYLFVQIINKVLLLFFCLTVFTSALFRFCFCTEVSVFLSQDYAIRFFWNVEIQAKTARCSKQALWDFKQALEVVVDWSESETVALVIWVCLIVKSHFPSSLQH